MGRRRLLCCIALVSMSAWLLPQSAAAEQPFQAPPRPERASAPTADADGAATVVIETTDPSSASEAVEAAGGSVTAAVRGALQAVVPAEAVPALRDVPAVDAVRAPRRATSASAPARGDDVEAAAANGLVDPWHAAGHVGAGTTVAIVDSGFGGYQALLGTHLPAAVTTDFDACGGDGDVDERGTAAAELVHDFAPAADLVLSCAQTDIEFVEVLDDLAGTGVDIVTTNLNFPLTSRGDGSGGPGTPAGAVAALRRNGVLVVASADDGWGQATQGQAIGGNGDDQFVQVFGGQDWMPLQHGETVGTTRIGFQWDAWPTTSLDFDLYVVDPSGACNGPDGYVAASLGDQAGSPSAPVEYLEYTNCSGFSTFRLYVDRFSGVGTPRFDLFVDGLGRIPFGIAATTYEPGASPAALTVGGICQLGSPGPYNNHSDWGPTIDGRQKPDVVTTKPAIPDGRPVRDGCTGGPFDAALLEREATAPQAAGVAALLLGASPDLDVAELQRLVLDRAVPLTQPPSVGTAGAGVLGIGPPGDASIPAPQPYTTVSPSRLVDTRPGFVGIAESTAGADRATPVGAGQFLTLPLRDLPLAGASTMTAVVLNVTVTEPTSHSFVTVQPGTERPTTSNLNVVPGQTVAQHVTATVGEDGSIRVFNQAGNSHVVIDVLGWYGPVGLFNIPATAGLVVLDAPRRAFDTRPGLTGLAEVGAPISQPLVGGASYDFRVAGIGDIPGIGAGVTAAVLNVTVTEPTATAHLSVAGTFAPDPLQTSSSNVTPGLTIANLVVAPIDGNGRVRFALSAGQAHVVVDVLGTFARDTGAGYVALDPPARQLDTRSGTGGRVGALQNLEVHTYEAGRYQGVPADAAAVLVSMIAVAPDGVGHLTAWPAGRPLPPSSNLNFPPNGIVPNATVIGLGAGGGISFRVAGARSHLVSDVAGYFVTAADAPG